jgi:hypothetical protein
MREALQCVVIAQDALSVDCVDFLLHDLRSFAVRGLVVHTASLNVRGIAEFRIRADTFFDDRRLDVVLIVSPDPGAIGDTSFIVPSADIAPPIVTPSSDRGVAGYQLSFRLEPLAEKMHPYPVPTRDLAATLLKRLSTPPA